MFLPQHPEERPIGNWGQMTYNYDDVPAIVGGRVRRLGILVWPDPDDINTTDVQLHLEVDCIDGICREMTCRTDPDGQTLRIDQERWPAGLPFSKLQERMTEWSSPEFWNRSSGHAYELFETANERTFGIGRGSTITAVHLVKFADDQGNPTGVVIEFDSQIRLWSGPSANGNSVRTNPEDFDWPAEIEITPVT